MRLPPGPPQSAAPKPRAHTRGMALVLVLAVMVLFSGLALAIFLTATTERGSSSLFSGSVETRLLADTSVNLVMAQISDATGQAGRAWVSQPGLIRTFTGNRTPAENYLLYSWGTMRVAGAFNPFAATNAVPSDWKQEKALFTDLNEPVPDPAAPKDTSRDRYPILYPPSLTGANVEGFSIQPNSVNASDNSVPMPVQWLYVLRDGTVKAATAGGTPDEVRVTGATSNNPIVGRIAFWTDDESAKVNVNTAAGGALWTEPRIETLSERAGYSGPHQRLGFSQPVRNEFQRYPGHPARTELRTVFPELTWNEIYNLAPRTRAGGSQNGTVNTVASSAPALAPAARRLYTSPGEVRFGTTKASATADRSFQTENFSSLTDPNAWTEILERRKGFITASSRAPELTLLGTPRVAIWPLHATDSTARRTALDRLVAFCSTITAGGAKFPFFFTRTDPLSENTDISLARNRQLYSYLQRLTDQPFPGASSRAFSTKYGGARGRDQILTEIFDYIRSSNLQDMQLTAANYYAPNALVNSTRANMGNGITTGFGRSLTVRQAGFVFICNADAANAASNRAPGETGAPGIKENRALDPFPAGKLQPNQRRVQGLFVVELFSPAAGFKSWTLSPTVRVTGLESAAINGTPLQFPAQATCPAPGIVLWSMYGGFGANGGAVNYRWLFHRSNGIGVGNDRARDVATTGGLTQTGGPASVYPFIGIPVTVAPDANGNMQLSGGTVTIEVFSDSAATNLLGRATLDIGSMGIRVPQLHSSNQYWAFHKSGIFGDNNPVGRFGPLGGTDSRASNQNEFLVQSDTVQTWILPHGDLRFLFGPESGSLTQLQPAPAGTLPNMRHFLLDLGGGPPGAGATSTLDPNFSMSYRQVPAMLPPASFPSGLNAPWTFGDWDTSTPIFVEDGPFINKPDEGSLYDANTSINPYTTQQANPAVSNLGSQYHSANRQISSPVMFGSLPTGIISGAPWQTLLFRPNPGNHPGASDPPDHLLLDLFWMPVVEPYAISEPFSTAGKVNMNYQMVPFTWIERSTGVRSVLANEAVLAIPNSTILTSGASRGYLKLIGNPSAITTASHNFNLAKPLNLDQTLAPFRQKFQDGEVFITPSEITTLPLIPQGQTTSTMGAFWQNHRPTGENLRERPYSHIYPRLTTKSNVFNVHYRVQTLRNPPGADPALWNENRGRIASELRGSTLIERFIDLNGTGIVDFALPSNAGVNAETLYRFRVLSTKDFNP